MLFMRRRQDVKILRRLFSSFQDPQIIEGSSSIPLNRASTGRGSKRHSRSSIPKWPSLAPKGLPPLLKCPEPTVRPEAADAVLHETSFTTPGGLFEALQDLLLLHDLPMTTLSRSAEQLKHNISRPSVTVVGELERRLTRLQWIGFLEQQVQRSGPTGRHVVRQLNQLMPSWDTAPDKSPQEHALRLDKETFTYTVSEAIALTCTEGRDWIEGQELLVRCLYPGRNDCSNP